MTRILTGAAFVLAPGAALAHPGHLADLAGHNHWVAGAAVGAAILVGLWAGLKGRGRKEEAETEEQDGAQPEADAA
ncbi:DUF6732 family protein [Mangrovicoccus sp. HB161399]|uniref:DUF6732 family protein n=1 Tax=Mangrovicoccus sp. HB161399 TaxID=2720392 RepID=UPI001553CBDC|nr:DUF6732 family protein [Mangrovicoccus sp. HB161399]